MYAKCGCFNDAFKVFDGMRERNLYTWSAVIGARSREQRWREVVELFFFMIIDGVVPDDFLFPKILQACGNCGDFETGKLIHCLVIKLGMTCVTRVKNSILAVYVKCGKMSWARRFFKSMDERDRVAWNSMISGYCQIGENEQAHRFFDEMCKEGIEPGLVTWNILIRSYNQLGQCEAAMELMKKMESLRISPDVFSWTCMISGFAQNGRTIEALDLFKEMSFVGVKPNEVTITSAISACTDLKALEIGLQLHSVAVKMGFIDDVLVGNSLIGMYSKCGELEDAERVFDMIKEKDIYTLNSMIGGYCQAGYCSKAYELFMKMQISDIPPDVITWNAMISGYIQNGNEDEAMDLFRRMEEDGKIKRNSASWNALIAGYLQLGQKNNALGVFRKMQSYCFSPNYVTILSVLPACAYLVAANKVKEIHSCVLRRNLDSSLPVMNSLMDTYAKSGNVVYSRTLFDGLPYKDMISWNSVISNYVLYGFWDTALDLFDQSRKFGFKPNRGTFVSVIVAHSLAGMVEEGKQVFSSITEDYQIIPMLEHYSAMVDLYGRSGMLGEAMEFIEDMPIKPDSSIWEALLTACRIHGNIDLAVYAVERLLELEPGNILIQHLILKTYAICGKPQDALKVRKLEKENSVKKSPGQSWIEIKNMVYTFVTGDHSKSYSDLLYSWLQKILENIKAHHSHSGLSIEEEEKEEISGVHSEKLALAFALVGSSPAPQNIRIPPKLPSILLSYYGKQANSLSLVEGEKKPVAVGPWGGQNGVHWDDGVYTTVRQLVIAHGAGIDSIQIEYDKKGSQVWSAKHGGNGGSKLDKVTLEYPDEFLTAVHGHYGTVNDWGAVCVRSLTFQSNKKTYGPFGIEQGTYFSFPMTGGKIVGFHGRSGWYLDAIGVYLKPLQNKNSSKSIVHSQSFLTNGSEKVGYSLVQGSVGESYDIVLAVKQKDSFGANHLPTILSRQSSSTSLDSSSDEDNKTKHNKMHSNDKLRSMDKLPIKVNGVLSYGPWGGSGGSTFDDGNFTGLSGVANMAGTGGFRNDRVIFDYPYEILTHITGTYGPLMYMGPNIIKSLTFHTTKGKHGPFGEEQGPSFTHKMNEGKIVGFHGKEGLFLDAIGVHVMEGKVSPQSNPVSNAINKSEGPIAEIDNPQWSNKLLVAKRGPTEEVACAVIKEPAPFGPGPWGGDGGRPWDDGVYSGVKQIFVTRGEAINSIQIEYDRNGQSVWSIKHGGNGGSFTHRIKMEYPHEMLNRLSGYYGPVSTDDKSKVIKSLTLYTSRGKYGPYGEEVGTYFTSTTTEGKIVGFHGRSSYYLDAIGVHMQHWLGNTQRTTRSFFKFLN
ncbi:hypothetical protein Patl1_09216 [Pistacia atlantica]|uniref:Uncharacterized protein n=1 Tax=Pistacia atlantica TaxID=434234 RepID=A0ACC1AK17_9ROSI|nr:hypothetical protein Patl1_09216 [Pistacia atlantica]